MYDNELEAMDTRFRIFGCLFTLVTKLEAIGNNGYLGELTTKQWYLMAHLVTFFKTPPTLTALSQGMGTSHQNTKAIALKLQNKGFVRLEKDEKDKRTLRVIPVKEKVEAYDNVMGAENEIFLDRFFDALNPEELSKLDSTLLKLLTFTENIQNEENKK